MYLWSIRNWIFLSTLPAWGATTHSETMRQHFPISIHAPRVGSDDQQRPAAPVVREISIHAPRVGSDKAIRGMLDIDALFLSTLPAWGATFSRRP